jgi:hypothetical protein
LSAILKFNVDASLLRPFDGPHFRYPVGIRRGNNVTMDDAGAKKKH